MSLSMSMSINKSLNSIILLTFVLLLSCPKTLSQTVTSATTGPISTGATDDDGTDDNDSDDAGEVDCEYDGSVKNYLTCAKNKISTPMLIGVGIGITLGIFVLSFLCIWLTKKKRRRTSQQKDQEQRGYQVSSNGEDGKNVDLIDLEKNQNQSKEFFYPDDKKDVKFSFISAVEEVKPKNPSNEDKNKSFELLAPPAPRNMHSRTASNSSSISNRPTILENGPTSLKPKPSMRKGSRDELYGSKPLKHAPSTRRPNPTFHKHMNQVSINGSIHGGEEREQRQSKSGEGSPVQLMTKRELEITNPSQSQPRHNSVLEVQHPRPSQPPLRDTSNRRSVTHLPKPISRSSISQHPPPSYAMGPQPPPPPPPASSTHNSYKPQMPLRGASQMTLALPPVLEDGKVSKSPSVSSRQSTLAPPAESEDAGRSGTFGPGLISAEVVKKQVNNSSKVDRDKVDIVEKEVLKDDKVSQIKYEEVGGSRKVDEVKVSNITSSDSTTAPAHTLNDNQRPVESLTTTPAVHTLKDTEAPKEESDESNKSKSRREQLRQTNLIPSYYVKTNGLNFDDEEEEDVPTVVNDGRDGTEVNVDEKKQHAEVSKDQETAQDQETAEKEKEKEREEESLANPFDAAEMHGAKGKKVRSEPKGKKEKKG